MVDVDLLLAVVVLAVFLAAAALVDVGLSTSWLVVGALATVAFETVAFAHHGRVREYWERPTVQVTALAGALVIALLGMFLAPVRIPSAGIGALVAYLGLRVLMAAGLIRTGHG